MCQNAQCQSACCDYETTSTSTTNTTTATTTITATTTTTAATTATTTTTTTIDGQGILLSTLSYSIRPPIDECEWYLLSKRRPC
ncbi:unnamed protein product [Rotaria sp. Silwood2]|nr:unnamed protein product [Rotaria sp. Silwood2]CAF2862492.1 unnamed protein product [Rotaria sp. Silwood2]CAF3262280.1 unnamed protein product [Rotaria sp. Silwood2]CAF4007360.1 unnamed protein product [Rotaria sp. Silwood2]CAF4095615.1 unnamed protein product [Rotaria sp. Silwood2]